MENKEAELKELDNLQSRLIKMRSMCYKAIELTTEMIMIIQQLKEK